MPRLTHKVPSYRLHKASGQAVVALNGRDHYLGPHGSPEGHEEYRRVLQEWLAYNRQSPAASETDVSNSTINDLVTPSYKMNLRLLDLHLDQIVPKDADPELFNEHGHLMDRELKFLRELARAKPERPRVLGYLGAESQVYSEFYDSSIHRLPIGLPPDACTAHG